VEYYPDLPLSQKLFSVICEISGDFLSVKTTAIDRPTSASLYRSPKRIYDLMVAVVISLLVCYAPVPDYVVKYFATFYLPVAQGLAILL